MPDYNDDIERYLSGKLTASERHRLEKKALSDPFLAEALEGAESFTSSEFSRDVNEIHQKINAQKKDSLFWPLRIAASVILIGAITIVTIRLTDSEINNQLALEQKPTVDNLTTPKIGPARPVPGTSAPTKPTQQGPVAETSDRQSAQPTIFENLQPPAEEERTKLDALSSATTPAGEDVVEPEVTKEEMDDKISEQNTGAVKARESDDEKPAAAPSTIDRAARAPSAMRSTPSKKKSEAVGGAAVAKDDAESPIVSNEPLPIGGMLQFNKYVEDNLRYPQRALNNSIQGDVIIEFQINANGSYRNFEVIRGLGFGCDEEAIRLINDGPKWTPAIKDGQPINNKPRVAIPFRIKKTSNE